MTEAIGCKHRALFVDRDGTIIHDTGYPGDSNEVELLPGIVATLLKYQAAGFLIIIVSNQSGMGRGFITREQYEAVQARTVALLADLGVEVTASYFCPHAPEDNCFCRKPRPGMLLLAAHDYGIDLAASVMMGDKVSDLEAGRAVGCQTVRVGANSLIRCKVE